MNEQEPGGFTTDPWPLREEKLLVYDDNELLACLHFCGTLSKSEHALGSIQRVGISSILWVSFLYKKTGNPAPGCRLITEYSQCCGWGTAG